MTQHSTELIVAKKVMLAKREFEKVINKMQFDGKEEAANVDNFRKFQEDF